MIHLGYTVVDEHMDYETGEPVVDLRDYDNIRDAREDLIGCLERSECIRAYITQ